MNRNSRGILQAVEESDTSLPQLTLGDASFWHFRSSDRDDFTRLGAAIGNNTHITKLNVFPSGIPSNVVGEAFYDGLKQNSSIRELALYGGNIASGMRHAILKVYQEKNNLTYLRIENANQHGEGHILATTFRCCTNISYITIQNCNITGEHCLPMVEAIREHRKLKTLNLGDNNIGNVGCEALATLLEDPHCNIQSLSLFGNNINNEGATAIANSLANNTKLKELYLLNNQFDESIVEDVFSSVLCNTSSMSDTYASNHTLVTLRFRTFSLIGRLSSSLILNKGRNKSCVAIKKILKYHPNIDMEPLFEWDADGEQTLKALPYIVDWFERAKNSVVDGRREGYWIEEKKLSAIFQFTTSMPLLCVPTSQIKVDNKKRKRGETK